MAKRTPSIIQKGDPRCFFCGRRTGLERHHVMTGPNRALAEEDGLWIWACVFHHTDPKEGVQYNREKSDALKGLAQTAYEARHSHDEWMNRYRKNYL